MSQLHRRALLRAALMMIATPSLAATVAQDLITVRARAGATTGVLTFRGTTFACAVGRAGVVVEKREGDGGTPSGRFPLRELRYRPDRMTAPATRLPRFAARANDGWCDDPADPAYNRLVSMPHQTDAETMWREDGLYDLVTVIGYNDDPVRPGAGSAIFMHVAENIAGGLGPTSGCVSLRAADLLAVLAACGPATEIDIRAV